MDPTSVVGLLACIESLMDGVFKIVLFINTVKERGKERLHLFTELNSLWVLLVHLQARFDLDNERLSERLAQDHCHSRRKERFLRPDNSRIQEPGGPTAAKDRPSQTWKKHFDSLLTSPRLRRWQSILSGKNFLLISP